MGLLTRQGSVKVETTKGKATKRHRNTQNTSRFLCVFVPFVAVPSSRPTLTEPWAIGGLAERPASA